MDGQGGKGGLAGMRVLVVEDEEVVARVDLHFTSTVVYGILVVERELDDAAIERSIAEINEAIRRSAARKT